MIDEIQKILSHHERSFQLIEKSLQKAKTEGKATITREELDMHDCHRSPEDGCKTCDDVFWNGVKDQKDEERHL